MIKERYIAEKQKDEELINLISKQKIFDAVRRQIQANNNPYGFRTDSLEFVRLVIKDLVSGELSTNEFSLLKKRIKSMINIVINKKYSADVNKKPEVISNKTHRKILDSMEKARWQEWKRTGTDPYDYNNLPNDE
jgi:hypothetical protein